MAVTDADTLVGEGRPGRAAQRVVASDLADRTLRSTPDAEIGTVRGQVSARPPLLFPTQRRHLRFAAGAEVRPTARATAGAR